MKHFTMIMCCMVMTVIFTACSSTQNLLSYISPEEETTEETTVDETSERTYIDEISGTVSSFDGSFLTIVSKEETYTFNISQSTVETSQGLICGDEVNVIYEGQLEGTDTTAVSVLKIVDDIHKKARLEPVTITGTLTNLSLNSITVKISDEQTLTLPITGVDQKYHNGLHAGMTLWITYTGNLEQNPSLVKLLDISDIDPDSNEESTFDTGSSKIRGYISNISNNTITVRLKGTSDYISVDLSSIPCLFNGGISSKAGMFFYYKGAYNGENMDGLTITCASSDDYSDVQTRKIASSITGTIQGSTADTFSILTSDGTFLICSYDEESNVSTGGLAAGCTVSVTFDPTTSRDTNILQSIKIQDA